jgi:hypothetical protein
MSSITPEQQTDLLFKQFNVVANTQQSDGYGIQPYLFRDNILNNQILSQTVPSTLPNDYSIANLDLCGNIAEPDGSLNLGVIGYPQLTYYKKLQLTQVPNSNGQAWWRLDGNGINILQDTIPFKFDETVVNAYDFQLYGGGGPPFINIGRDEPGTLWLMDNKTGIIEFYEDPVILQAGTGTSPPINNTNPPFLSFIAYTGTKGITGGGGGGGDASFNTIDVSNIILDGNNLMQKFSAEPWDTGLLTPTLPPTSPVTKEYIIAEVDEPTANALGYFTIQLGAGQYQNITFLAGISNSPATPVIKVLSNIVKGDYGFNNLNIIQDATNAIFYLTTTVDITSNGSPTFGGGLNVTLVNNNENLTSIPPLKNWSLIFQELPPGPTYTRLIDLSLNLIPVENIGMTSQDEYFNRNIYLGPRSVIFPDPGNQVPIINPTGTVDICGGLYVLNETYLNQDTGIRGQLDVCANIVGGNDLIGLSGEIIGQGNSVFVNYKYFDDSDFLTEHCTSSASCVDNLSANWCIIAKLDGNGLVNNSCIFQIIDRSAGLDVNLTFILGVNDGSSPIFSLNVLENNYSNNYTGNGFFIRNLRVVSVTPGSFTTQKFYLQLDRVAYASSSPTRLDVRTYLNTQNVQSGSDPVYPWILGSYGNTLPSGTTIYPLEVNLQQQSGNGTKCNVVTNAYSVNLNGGFFGYNVDMNNNDITNINQLKGGSSNNDIRFQINSLEIEGDTILKLKNSNGTNTIDYSNNTLDFQNTNTIDKILSIRGQHNSILTIGNTDDNILIDGSSVEIRSKGGGPPFGDIILNNSGGGNGSIIMKNGNVSKGDIQFKASIGFDLSNNKLRVDKMEPSTTNVISFNDKDITDISNVKTRINFNAPTNMYTDTSANITTNLTTTGDIGFDTSNKLWSYAENSNKYIIANNNRVWFSTSNLPIASYNSGGSPSGLPSGFTGGFYIIPSEIVNYSIYHDYRNGVGGIQNDYTDFGTGYLKYIEVQNNGIIRGGGSKLNDIYITQLQASPTTEPFYVKVNIKPSGGSWGTAQTLQSFDIPVTSVGATTLRGANFISNIPVATGDLIRIELVFTPTGVAQFIFGQNSVGSAPYPTPSAAGTTTLANGPRAMVWLDLLEYIPQLT